jgi:membrane protein involved in D-alanine export
LQWVIAAAFLRWKTRASFYAAIAFAILPLLAAKIVPELAPHSTFGFLGISYVTFRALDVVFSINDGLIKVLKPAQYFAFLFFLPTISSGPIDRYRRFAKDWEHKRTRAEFITDLDSAVHHLFRGFAYKFILAALIRTYWTDRFADEHGAGATFAYMYGYTLYLFFDFAGYSAFAVGLSRLFGVHTPENFHLPFLSKNIRDFWNRWHISLSFWFRDHVYMRFLLAATKGKWFKGKHTASYAGLFLTFGLMGVWHGLSTHYIIYGLYHAALLCGYDAFARWNKQRKLWGDSPAWRWLNIILTLQVVAFGFLIFSGRLNPRPGATAHEAVESVDCHEITGWAWDPKTPEKSLLVDLYIDDAFISRTPADIASEAMERQGAANDRHGFVVKLPGWVRDGREHTIEMRLVHTGQMVPGTPRVITCEKDAAPR